MKQIISVSVLLAGSAFAAPIAFAADVLPVAAGAPVVTAPVVTNLAGYVDLFGGIANYGEFDYVDGEITDRNDLHRGPMFGGAGRIAYAISPSFGIQADAWTQLVNYQEYEEEDGEWVPFDDFYSERVGGIGLHLTFSPAAA